MILLGWLVARRWRLSGRLLGTVGILSLYLSSLPYVGALLLTAVAVSTPELPVADNRTSVEAIVVLAAGNRAGLEYAGETVGTMALERVRFAAVMHRLTGLPILVTGGAGPRERTSPAVLMRDALETEFGVPVRWVETDSRNTFENAVNSAALLKAIGFQRDER